jgi:prepilin-type N-terminal cleavage/methylation domain-containing protein
MRKTGFVKHGAFTLVEVLITLTILSIATLAIFRGNVFNLRTAKEAAELTTAVIAADTIMKETIGRGFPESGIFEGTFEGDYFHGLKWKKEVAPFDLPFITDLKLLTVQIEYGDGRIYTLETAISRY